MHARETREGSSFVHGTAFAAMRSDVRNVRPSPAPSWPSQARRALPWARPWPSACKRRRCGGGKASLLQQRRPHQERARPAQPAHLDARRLLQRLGLRRGLEARGGGLLGGLHGEWRERGEGTPRRFTAGQACSESALLEEGHISLILLLALRVRAYRPPQAAARPDLVRFAQPGAGRRTGSSARQTPPTRPHAGGRSSDLGVHAVAATRHAVVAEH
jgi:hypothetical protein